MPRVEADAAQQADERRLYAIGDIHGRADLLDRLAGSIATDCAGYPQGALTIFLGDYIDRGPKSADVLERLSAEDWPVPFIALRGNHEQMLLRFLKDATYLDAWRRFGGLETLSSFGINGMHALDRASAEEVQRELVLRLPPSLLEFLVSTPTHCQTGRYYFCHAGIRPGVPLAQQTDKDLLWIREAFTDSQVQHEKTIVHGHTPVEEPEVRKNRINIDTGAYMTGVLTCLVLQGEEMRFLST